MADAAKHLNTDGITVPLFSDVLSDQLVTYGFEGFFVGKVRISAIQELECRQALEEFAGDPL